MDPTRPRTSGPKAGKTGTPRKGDVEVALPRAGVAAGQGEDDAQKRYRLALLQGQKMKREAEVGAQGPSGARKPSPSRRASASPSKRVPSPAATHPMPGSARTTSTGFSSASSHASPPQPARSTGNPRPATAAAPLRGASEVASPSPHHVAAASIRGRVQRTQGSPEKARPMSARKVKEEAEESDESLDFSGALPAGISGKGFEGANKIPPNGLNRASFCTGAGKTRQPVFEMKRFH